MKILKLTAGLMLCILFVQCNTMERRQSKAEEAIEKKLFETLDNFQSYEKISTEIDTLKEVWIFDDDIVATGHKLVGYQNEAAKLDDRIREINYNLEQYQESATRSFWSGNGSSLLVDSSRSRQLRERVEKPQETERTK